MKLELENTNNLIVDDLDLRNRNWSAIDDALDTKADKSDTYTKTEVDTSLGLKADKTYVDNQDAALTAQLADIEQEIESPLNIDTQKIADNAISPDKLTLFKLSTNLLNHFTIIKDKSVNPTTGEVIDNAGGNSVSQMIPIKPSTVYTSYRLSRKAFYDINKNFISSDTINDTFTTPANACYMRFVGPTGYMGFSAQLNLGSTLLPFEPYYALVDNKVIQPKSLSPDFLSNSALRCFVTGGLVDFDFNSNLIKFSNIRLTWGTYNVLVNQNFDMKSFDNAFTHVLYYNVDTELIGTTSLRSVPAIPKNAIPICAFRKAYREVFGLENYKINGKPRFVSGLADKCMIDTAINKTFIKNVVLPENAANISAFKSADIYALYDSLMSQYPTYITKTLLGNEPSPSALPLYRYDFKPKRPVISAPIKQIKYIVASGAHPEKAGVWTLYNTLKNICDNWQSSELLEALRFNVHFIVIPVTSPWAYDNGSRVNYNGVDLARNFPAGWTQGEVGYTWGGTEPLSEIEAQVINQIMFDNRDALGAIDVHNFFTPSNNYNFLWGACANDFTKQIMMNHIQKMDRKWKKDYTFINQSHDVFIGDVTGAAPGGSLGAQAHAYGIKGALTYEVCHKVFADPTSTSYDSNTLTMGYEAFTNFLLQFTDELLKNQ